MATLSTQDIKPMAKGDIEAKERIFLNADRSAAVPADHEDAHVLLAGEGGMIAKEDADKFGIGEDGKLKHRPGKKHATKHEAAAADDSDNIEKRNKRVVSADSKK